MLQQQQQLARGASSRQPRLGRRALRVQAAGSTYGNNFRVTTFGESHGKGVGCVIDGVPPRLRLTQEEIQFELDRRRPGQSIITTPRKEEDTCEILSGVFDGVTLGTPIAVVVRNKDQRSGDYSEMSVAYRPSHADATYDFKYGIRAVAGGGRSSARETIGRVAAGAVAKKLLKVVSGTEVREGAGWQAGGRAHGWLPGWRWCPTPAAPHNACMHAASPVCVSPVIIPPGCTSSCGHASRLPVHVAPATATQPPAH
jgi:chorismate synthase